MASYSDIRYKRPSMGLKKGNKNITEIKSENDDLIIETKVTDKDIHFKGSDDGSVITALTLDMSDGGSASFNHNVTVGGNLTVTGTTTGVSSDLVDDTTPQLGGDLASNGNDIIFSDNDKAIFGTGSDLQIYHNGSHSFLDNNTGDMSIESSNVYIKANNTENSISALANGSVELYYDNAKKFGTLSDGASVFSSAGCNFVIKCGDNTSNSELRFGDSDSDNPGVIYYVHSDNSMRFNTGGSEEMRLENDGDLHVDGDVIAFSTTVSDVALKSDIEVIPNALDKVNEIRGVTFTRHNGRTGAGIIAQELEKVLPQAVKEKILPLQKNDNKKYKTVEYDSIHGLLIEAIKELSKKVEQLEKDKT